MTLWWRDVVAISAVSLVWFTVSKAFDGSIAIATLRRRGGRGLLKPVAILCTNGNRAEVVDLSFRKLCWVSDRFRCRSKRSRTLMVELRREIGR